jgi:hypothetical protein
MQSEIEFPAGKTFRFDEQEPCVKGAGPGSCLLGTSYHASEAVRLCWPKVEKILLHCHAYR